MHSLLRSVVETCSTLAFVAFLVPMLVILLWRSLRIRPKQMLRLVEPYERAITVVFLVCLTLLEPVAIHLPLFVPAGVAAPLPTSGLLAWLTANVFSVWCIGMAAWSRSYLRVLLYLPLPIQTSTLLFVSLDSVSQGQASLATLFVVAVALLGVCATLFVPKIFQCTEEMLCAIDPATASYAMSRLLSKNPIHSKERGPAS